MIAGEAKHFKNQKYSGRSIPRGNIIKIGELIMKAFLKEVVLLAEFYDFLRIIYFRDFFFKIYLF